MLGLECLVSQTPDKTITVLVRTPVADAVDDDDGVEWLKCIDCFLKVAILVFFPIGGCNSYNS